ncbi:MAG: glycosyltransferase family 4 protein [Actinobacteria bacterium]|nr:MAG: glycosyltransferase family 4 protein [Actinomycetota bacterium]
MNGRLRVGWATSSTLRAGRATFRGLETSVAMRIANVARWLNRNTRIQNELYRRGARYDVVVFVKAMDEVARTEAERVRAGGGKVVFDANVNYYEIWGEYDIPGTRPTEEQQRDAEAMTRGADAVVTDSSYLLGIVRRFNERSEWIPDNVDLSVFRPRPEHQGRGLRLVWSGRSQKARPLTLLREPLEAAGDVELVVVSDARPAELDPLTGVARCSYEPFSLRGYARTLRSCDAIVSPKRLVNGYELGHSEWKITLGMGAGLPAVASPQQSYVEAIGARGGGIVADSAEEWAEAFERLRDPAERAYLGARARQTVEDLYSTPVVARRYGEFLLGVA